VVTWNGSDLGRWTDVLEGADVVINLAGRTVNCRYTAANQRDIRNSRTITTGLIGEAIARTARPPRLWLNASTATIYRHSLDAPMDDVTGQVGGTEPGAPASWRFSVEVAKAWEDAFFAQALPRTRRVALRTAMVMSPEPGGAFDMFLRLVRWGLGGSIASGWQYVSWIHDVDLIRALEFLIAHDEINGPVNISSPEPVSNRRFMRCLRSAWCTSYVAIPTPGWVLPLGAMLLRTETELVLKSRRVEPRRLLAAGFDFHFPNWRGACHNLVSRWRQLQPE
jgi:uncharacterized protein (TIGR01777 family)